MFEFEFFAGIAGWVLPLASIGIILFWGRRPDHVPRWFNWSDVAAPSHTSAVGFWHPCTRLLN